MADVRDPLHEQGAMAFRCDVIAVQGLVELHLDPGAAVRSEAQVRIACHDRLLADMLLSLRGRSDGHLMTSP